VSSLGVWRGAWPLTLCVGDVNPGIAADAKGALLTAGEGIDNADPSCNGHVTATKGTYGSLIKFTTDGAYAAIAVDRAGRSGVIFEGGTSHGSAAQARVGS